MPDTLIIKMAQRGTMTFPKPLRDAYKMKEGDIFTLIDLGGVFVLSPRRSRVDKIADELAEEWRDSGETLESMLRTLREIRESDAE